MNSRTEASRMAYGYLRVLSDAAERAAYAQERDMKCFAEERGFQLVAIYHEFVCGALDAFNEMVEALSYTGARLVVVPSLSHLGESGRLRDALLDRFEFGVEARVYALDTSLVAGA
ncbi:recombinase family protein [Streptomyces sp. NP-1717]|uniref:recombinase family protein n=1 Tax=Streptomyces sp. NP-1717 TaxID=2704470 RepID=UPI001F5C1693|nr:recombinase family protein [Streptomyces sp. NP-1717]MCI3224734.1 recombinase family protein [Streptomyces sp. NP-1717]